MTRTPLPEWFAGRIAAGRGDKTRAAVLHKAMRALQVAKVRTLEELCAMSPAELLRVKGIGPSAVWLIDDLLQAEGKSLHAPGRRW